MLLVQAPPGIPVLTRGDDVAAVIAPALATLAWPDGSVGLGAGDVVVISSKIVSKAEGRMIAARDREDAISSQTVREVARRERADGSVLRIVENPLGLVMAAAGVDASNTPPGTVLLLPEDPDGSARRIRRGLAARFGVRPGVLLTDTSGRPWRDRPDDPQAWREATDALMAAIARLSEQEYVDVYASSMKERLNASRRARVQERVATSVATVSRARNAVSSH